MRHSIAVATAPEIKFSYDDTVTSASDVARINAMASELSALMQTPGAPSLASEAGEHQSGGNQF